MFNCKGNFCSFGNFWNRIVNVMTEYLASVLVVWILIFLGSIYCSILICVRFMLDWEMNKGENMNTYLRSSTNSNTLITSFFSNYYRCLHVSTYCCVSDALLFLICCCSGFCPPRKLTFLFLWRWLYFTWSSLLLCVLY